MVWESVQPSTNPGHALAEVAQNLVPRLCAPLVLDCIVQQCRDGFVLVSTVFEYDRRGGE